MNIGQGSLEECKYYIILSSDLEYGDNKELEVMADEVSKLLVGYIKAIDASK
jgi:four helix bundle protein